VQVGAYAERAQADEAVLRLRSRRIDARVEGQGPRGASPPFRVRVGRFATRAAADAERRALAARGAVGFVAEAAPAPRAPVAAPAPTLAQSPLDLAADDAATAGRAPPARVAMRSGPRTRRPVAAPST
jgi:hypothetical protein